MSGRIGRERAVHLYFEVADGRVAETRTSVGRTFRGDGRFFVIMYCSDGYGRLDPLRSVDIGDSSTLEQSNVCSLLAALSDVQDHALHHLTYCFFSSLHEAFGSDHSYL